MAGKRDSPRKGVDPSLHNLAQIGAAAAADPAFAFTVSSLFK